MVLAALVASMVVVGAVGGGLSVGEGPMEAVLENVAGVPARLSGTRGLPVVLFYEDRDSLKVNQRLKDELFNNGKDQRLLQSVRVVAVANVQPFNFFPAKPIALAFVRNAQAKAGIPIWLDWSASLSRPPWGLPERSSSVVLLDADGMVVFQRSGVLSDAERTEFFETLSRVVGR